MEIYFLRHGIAEDHSPAGNDAERRLTNEGREKLRCVLKRAHAAEVRPTLMISSPLKRAVETAEIAAHELGFDKKIVRSGALTPGSTPMKVWDELRLHREEESVLLAGHDPLFSQA